MNIIIVKQNAYDAITWASKQFGSTAFKVKNDFPSRNWRFEFNNAKHATHFALKWI